MKFSTTLGGAILAMACATGAQAATLTFDAQSPTPITESGYTYQNSAAYGSSGVLQMTSDGGQTSATFMKSAGGYFDASTVDMAGTQRVMNNGGQTPAYDNYTWNGYRDGQLVASDSGSLNNWNSFSSYSFSGAFAGLSKLELVLNDPNYRHQVIIPGFFVAGPNVPYCDTWCSGIAIDNLVLNDAISPVPLPGGLALMGSALGLGWVVTRRRKVKIKA